MSIKRLLSVALATSSVAVVSAGWAAGSASPAGTARHAAMHTYADASEACPRGHHLQQPEVQSTRPDQTSDVTISADASNHGSEPLFQPFLSP